MTTQHRFMPFLLALICATTLPLASGSTQTVACGVPGVSVVYDPVVSAGTLVTMTINNRSAFDLLFTSNCYLGAIYYGSSCSGLPASKAYCGAVDILLPKDTSVTTNSVASTYVLSPGPYFVPITYSAGGVVFKCCLPITIQSGLQFYGPSKPGTDGVSPNLGVVPQTGPKIGTKFLLELRSPANDVPAVLLMGGAAASVPLPWGTLLVATTPPFIAAPLFIDQPFPFGPGGSATISFQLPNVPALVGFTGFVQAVVQDPGAAGGVSHTNGMKITVGI